VVEKEYPETLGLEEASGPGQKNIWSTVWEKAEDPGAPEIRINEIVFG